MTLPDGQKYPAASVDVVQAVHASGVASLRGRYVPAGHGVQALTVALSAALYVPPGQAVPAPVTLPDGQKYPAASVDVVQAAHVSGVASLNGRYVPAGHGVQVLTVALLAPR